MAKTKKRHLASAYADGRWILRRREAVASGAHAWDFWNRLKSPSEWPYKQFSRGVYVRDVAFKSLHGDKLLALLATEIPEAIFCLRTALYLHDYEPYEPNDVWVMLPARSWIPRGFGDDVRFMQCSPELHSAGVEVRQHDGVDIRFYSLERSIVEAFKYRKKIDPNTGPRALTAALHSFLVREEELLEWAERLRVNQLVRSWLAAWKRRDPFPEIDPEQPTPVDPAAYRAPRRKPGRPPTRRDPLPGVLLPMLQVQGKLPDWVAKRAERRKKRNDDEQEEGLPASLTADDPPATDPN